MPVLANVSMWAGAERPWPTKRLPPLPGWHERAACAGDLDPEWMAEDGPLSSRIVDTCTGCPVVRDCARWALASAASGTFAGARYRDGLRVPAPVPARRRHRRRAPA